MRGPTGGCGPGGRDRPGEDGEEEEEEEGQSGGAVETPGGALSVGPVPSPATLMTQQFRASNLQ